MGKLDICQSSHSANVLSVIRALLLHGFDLCNP